MKFFDNIKPDLSSGFSTALVALPLSVGIALASGAPASSGIIAAIIGGILGSWLGGSNVTINGPAAGLIVIVLEAIQHLGDGSPMSGFRGMLAAGIVAGALQVVFGLLKFARKGLSFPASIIHGMMCAIGMIIVAKQVHLLFGYSPTSKNPILLYAEIPKAILNIQPAIFAVGIISLGLLIVWPKINLAITKKIPAQLASKVAQEVKIPIIGIGAGGGVDGQVLVLHDMLGITHEFHPRFLRRYMNLYDDIKSATESYIKDVKSKDFPSEKEQY